MALKSHFVKAFVLLSEINFGLASCFGQTIRGPPLYQIIFGKKTRQKSRPFDKT
jgi:hypothetical protein